jgi:hypothetical protein
MTPHGFRAMARTLIVERLPGISPDVIEAQLVHGRLFRRNSVLWRQRNPELRRHATAFPAMRRKPAP